MKQIIYILLLFPITLLAQESNNISVVQSPNSYDDGFSIAIQYEHQNNIIYVGPELYHFPKLNNIDYTHLIGRFGLNANLKVIRFYAGTRIGGIYRQERVHALLGLEAGLDINITKNIFIGASYASDMKTDSKLWGNEDYHTVNSGFVRLGFKF
ncbi:MAG: hypothetical protein CMC76_12195 [Flavobacteriaceae bacterium]|nr:hypothetical protein [Flavobacteriaceae bacterium]|tara:strand:+ start:7850 stop:8311 length:462 start_codon:yes stop_codon:yes gene_type:complete